MALFVFAARADTVALWLFDEPVGVHPGAVLNDTGPRSYSLILGPGAEITSGRFGNALRLLPRAAAAATHHGSPLRPAPSANATATKLNLGAHDWTLDCWLRLERSAAEEGVIYEVGCGPPGENPLVTRFSVLPRANAFLFSGVTSSVEASPRLGDKRIEFPNPEGPPTGVATMRDTTLALDRPELPRDTWFHMALVYRASSGELRLFIDGKVRAAAAVSIRALPHGAHAYVSVGRDARGQRSWEGCIDELRVSDHAAYTADSDPPGSLAR